MNRLVLIGNGFDLAHKNKTSYKDFIDYFWSKYSTILDEKKIDLEKCEYPKHIVELKFLNSNDDEKELNLSLCDKKSDNEYKAFCDKLFEYNLHQLNISNNIKIIFHNLFFKKISEKFDLQNWVDIENEYYDSLISLLPPNVVFDADSKLEKLNKDFEDIKQELIKYLRNISSNEKIDEIDSIITGATHLKLYPTFKGEKLKQFLLDGVNEKLLYHTQNRAVCADNYDIEELINKIDNKNRLTQIDSTKIDLFVAPRHITCLDFNYTNTIYKYYQQDKFDVIKIHGSLDEKNQPIIFGYGDEMDNSYHSIEYNKNNLCLDYIKSILYAENNQYRRLINFIESEEYEICIMGHSCGLSDRTLLYKIFNHENCKIIKIYYYKISDTKDDFREKIANISRCFNDKSKMRELLVDKTNSEKLPQLTTE